MDTITKTRVVIKPAQIDNTDRQATITGLAAGQISTVLGFEPNVEDDPYKVENSWAFTVDGQECAVWDYKGSHHFNRHSAFGPRSALVAVFGARHVTS